ncbi:PREDICTED: coatomer subunit beta-2-like [Ipomoea nil]|uniref:coatomer subunit beta-2-like n=1 Tax=Ipomoea nil TaxID=35883 RepID=UPI0009012CEC|nr:PREDICTED: coatomer subunit beta-2-like [Ipomoea nil]
MWAEFEWENKVAVHTVIQNEKEFLDHIIKSTNMKCLTAPSALEGECGFLAANLYAKSVFGEDALVSVSIEKQADGKLSGYIRIRSKTQGIALSLGDKITLKQKKEAIDLVLRYPISKPLKPSSPVQSHFYHLIISSQEQSRPLFDEQQLDRSNSTRHRRSSKT